MKTLPAFKNKKLFELAFTHRSYLNESKDHKESNERLEFLGDSVISFIVSGYLYKTYPHFTEGTLTNLRSLMVNTKTLGKLANSLSFGTLLKLSKGEEESQGRKNQTLLANCFEAFVGALFLDQGIETTTSFLSKNLLYGVKKLLEKKTFKDPKSLLQELVQAKKQSAPAYKVLEEKGPAHSKFFTIGVYVENTLWGTGKGRSKQEAEEQAAQEALDAISHF
ncbi:MAG: ribonuclease III [Candidatus Levybacteria bacterium RIFCSPHIGHO2_02_FULL_42_12]|nr:MAG: ribonuclease III [Candidatus Levybacteria bacterium RIFCSPHIGHO2_01_FULL_42_15]OGH30867.1 MAG: ribonuclease III [Candidatus Levybacteria bacterium RIFCSPHIGHO2_02_FULL_42_12]OGH42107.1 MAG: ribonuclease III [Candidatus Levybacteria bacterium RIFCSPLOWO2_01_FULL_42_15]